MMSATMDIIGTIKLSYKIVRRRYNHDTTNIRVIRNNKEYTYVPKTNKSVKIMIIK